jgi:nitroreductase
MDMLQGLLNRVSMPLLVEPAPTEAQLENLWQAALRAPDHGNLKPYRFLVIAGDKRTELGELLAQRLLELKPETGDSLLAKTRNMPARAPMLIALVACPQEHPKVPLAEQVQSAACAGQNILHAAFAQGLGAVWRTGWVAEDKQIQATLGLSESEQMLGYIYIGTPKTALREVPVIDATPFVSQWTGA